MTTIWHIDSCDCVIEYDNSLTVKKIHNKCNLHKNSTNSTIYSDITNHRRSKNLLDKEGDSPATTMNRTNSRQTEKDRIRKMEVI